MNGRPLSLFQAWNGGDLLVPKAGCLPCKCSVSMAPRLMTSRLNVVVFREMVKTSFSGVMETALDEPWMKLRIH